MRRHDCKKEREAYPAEGSGRYWARRAATAEEDGHTDGEISRLERELSEARRR